MGQSLLAFAIPMYLLLGLAMYVAFPVGRPWEDTDLVWAMAVVNLLVGVLVWKRPDFRRVVTWLVLVDAIAGTAFTFISATANRLDVHLPQTRGGVAAVALLGIAWIASGSRSYELLLPARGIWAKKLAAGLTLAAVQIASFSGLGPRALFDSQKSIYVANPMDLMAAGTACTVTLILYLLPAWHYLSNSAPRKKATAKGKDEPVKD